MGSANHTLGTDCSSDSSVNVMVRVFSQWFACFRKGAWVNAMVRRFSQRFVVVRNGSLVCVFLQWFVSFRKGFLFSYFLVDLYYLLIINLFTKVRRFT